MKICSIHVRLLSYDEAEKLIQFVDSMTKSSLKERQDYEQYYTQANISSGYVNIQLGKYRLEDDYIDISNYLQSTGWTYEIGLGSGNSVLERIVNKLKNKK